MAVAIAYRVAGRTYGLNVGNTSHAAVLLNTTTPDQVRYCAVVNPTTADIAVRFSEDGSPATLPALDGTPGDFVVPGGNAGFAMVFAVPSFPCYVTAISTVAGPSALYVTPVDGS